MAGTKNARYGFFAVDGPFNEPQWLVAADVEGVCASPEGDVAIHMKSGNVFYTASPAGDVLARVDEARG